MNLNFTFDLNKRNKVLGIDPLINSKYVCFLPGVMEFGWYIMCMVKRVHGFNHNNKIVCCKPGHEALFPSASLFFYDWQDVDDDKKAGIYALQNQNEIKEKILKQYNILPEEITFLYPEESGWDEKISLAEFTFIPRPKNDLNIKVDVVLCPRNRQMDPLRNWTKENWQKVVNGLVEVGYNVGLCGVKETSFNLDNVKFKSWDYLDIEGDLNLMLHSKCICVQESGLAYLAYLTNKPIFFVGKHLHADFGADLHRNKDVFFHETICWHDPNILVNEIISFLRKDNMNSMVNP